MWPFGKKPPGRLAVAGAGAPTKVSVLTTIVSPNALISPLTGMSAAMIHLEILERIAIGRDDESETDTYELLGVVNLGDLATLRDEDGDEITIVVGRVRIDPQLPRRGGSPLTIAPAEVVPLMMQASGRGVVCYRELTLGRGDKVRLNAIVEPSTGIVSAGYRSGLKVTYVARDDLSPVALEEVLEVPSF